MSVALDVEALTVALEAVIVRRHWYESRRYPVPPEVERTGSKLHAALANALQAEFGDKTAQR